METFLEKFEVFYDKKLQTLPELYSVRIRLNEDDIDSTVKMH